MTDLSIFETEAPKSESDLASLVKLAEEAVSLERTLEDIEQEQKQVTARLNVIKTKELPEKLAELGMDDFTLTNGGYLKVKPLIAGSIPKDEEKRQAALQYLRDLGGASLIKNKVSLAFGKNEDNFAKNAISLLQENGYQPETSEDVHHKTLSSFVGERLENGEEVDGQKLGVFIGRTTEIKLGKSK